MEAAVLGASGRFIPAAVVLGVLPPRFSRDGEGDDVHSEQWTRTPRDTRINDIVFSTSDAPSGLSDLDL